MPAQTLQRVSKGGVYCHIYNKGVDNRTIFADDSDYQVFLGFLEDYLTVPKPPEDIKKDFTINNRTFRGVPHQPKNYSEKVELIAYSLKPNHFHLLLHQKTEKSLQAFLRSLCTRYSMYFNKKYRRTGPLFEGPYRSVQVDDETGLLLLTRYFHKEGGYSTYPEFTGQKQTPWVKTKVVQSIENSAGSYKDFVEKYEQDKEEEGLLAKITIETVDRHLKGRDLGEVKLRPWSRIPELAGASAVFVLLLSLGLRNVTAISQSPEVAHTTTLGTNTLASPAPTAEPEPKIILTVRSDHEPVNIREKPTVYSNKIGEALDGDTFEFVSESPSWVEVKLPEDSTGFIFSKYTKTPEDKDTENIGETGN